MLSKLSYLNIALLALSGLCSGSAYAASNLLSLSDDELAGETGQALMSLSYIAPSDAANLEKARSGLDVGFYRLGLEAELELNANIKKLQLGCGGVNGIGGCDVDIDNLSLSGLGNSATSNTSSAADRAARVGSSAKLTNPFIEFAIQNPETAALREVVGIRLSAEKVLGLLTAGTENSTVPNGINTISGFMRIQSNSSGYVYGKANTGARFLEAVRNASYVVDGEQVYYNNEITGTIDAAGIAELEIRTVSGGLQIPAMSSIPFIRPGVTVNQNRISALPLKATLAVPTIKADFRGSNQTVNPNYPPAGTVQYHNPNETIYPNTDPRYSPIDWNFNVPQEVRTQGGALNAQITKCNSGCTLAAIAGVNVGDVLQNDFIKGNITGITGNVTINQGLGYIHYLPIDSSGPGSVPTYLSLQGQAIRWPDSYSGPNPERTNINGTINTSVPETITDVAQKGWWLSLGGAVNLGSVDPVQNIDIAPLFPQIAAQVSTFLNTEPYPSIGLSSLFNAIVGTGDINVTLNQDVNLSSAPLSLTLTDLQLGGQSFTPNCYGGLTFC